MWTSVLIAMAAAAACGGPIQPVPDAGDSAHARCVAEAILKVPPGRAVTLFSRDGSRATGEILGLDASQGLVRLLPDGGQRPGRAAVWFAPPDAGLEPRALRAADVTRVEWRTYGESRVTGALLGLLIGGVIGYAIGDAAKTEPRAGWLDLSGLRRGINTIGATAMGGALGAALGAAVASGAHRTRAIDCPYEPAALPGR